MKLTNRMTWCTLLVLALSLVWQPVPAQESETVVVEVSGVGRSLSAQSPAVLLYAEAEARVLAIFIGEAEASAITRYLGGIRTLRPMTHDLIGNLLDVFNGKLERVIVSDFRDSTYFALLVIRLDDKVIRVDARPSDAIAVALKQGVPIEVERKVMEALALPYDEDGLMPPPLSPDAQEVPWT